MYHGPFCYANAGQYEIVFMTGNDGRAQCDAVRLEALSVRRLRADFKRVQSRRLPCDAHGVLAASESLGR
jgi:hypothetical protein